MEILKELTTLVEQGFYVTLIIMFLFYFLPYRLIKTGWIKEALIRLTIVAVAFLIVWLTNGTPVFEWTKTMIKEALVALAFSSLFYEFAGKFVVKKWFKNYKTK